MKADQPIGTKKQAQKGNYGYTGPALNSAALFGTRASYRVSVVGYVALTARRHRAIHN
jgi:hypothetical protein